MVLEVLQLERGEQGLEGVGAGGGVLLVGVVGVFVDLEGGLEGGESGRGRKHAL